MHIGHDHEELDRQDLALRRLGAGLIQEQNGCLAEALAEYEAALDLDPELLVAEEKVQSLSKQLFGEGGLE